jgi:uncharacterized phage protein (TIGR01671 family)
MRDILFRAKRVKDGKWVEGFYSYRAFEGKLDHIIFQPAIAEYDYTEWGYLVDPTTVGQYTGLTANGKKIFEGDIVEWISEDNNGSNITSRYTIEWRDDDTALGWHLKSTEGYPYDECSALTRTEATELEVIGNIHDNPELLEDKS